MKNTTLFSLLFLSVGQLTGCVFSPGQDLSITGKKVMADGEANYQLDQHVEIYPLTRRSLKDCDRLSSNLRQILLWMSRLKTGNTA